MGEGTYGRAYVWEFGGHAPAVVNHEPNGHRSVVLFKYRKFLQLAVFEYPKIFLFEAGDKCSARVRDFHGQQD
ncbi:MAG: hypothetical protein PVS2B2_00300 [Candidatus Acidiferrum sp.]